MEMNETKLTFLSRDLNIWGGVGWGVGRGGVGGGVGRSAPLSSFVYVYFANSVTEL